MTLETQESQEAGRGRIPFHSAKAALLLMCCCLADDEDELSPADLFREAKQALSGGPVTFEIWDAIGLYACLVSLPDDQSNIIKGIYERYKLPAATILKTNLEKKDEH